MGSDTRLVRGAGVAPGCLKCSVLALWLFVLGLGGLRVLPIPAVEFDLDLPRKLR